MTHGDPVSLSPQAQILHILQQVIWGRCWGMQSQSPECGFEWYLGWKSQASTRILSPWGPALLWWVGPALLLRQLLRASGSLPPSPVLPLSTLPELLFLFLYYPSTTYLLSHFSGASWLASAHPWETLILTTDKAPIHLNLSMAWHLNRKAFLLNTFLWRTGTYTSFNIWLGRSWTRVLWKRSQNSQSLSHLSETMTSGRFTQIYHVTVVYCFSSDGWNIKDWFSRNACGRWQD